MVEKLNPDPPHLQALEALQADLPISGGVSEWLDKHRDQVVAVEAGLSDWGQVATLLGISPNSLRSWGVRRGLRTRKPREKKPRQKPTQKPRQKPRQKKARQAKGPPTPTPLDFLRERNQLAKGLQVSRDFKGIKLTLTLEFLEEAP